MPTIDVMPMTTPRTVNPERSLLVRTVSNAIAITSQNSARRIAIYPADTELAEHAEELKPQRHRDTEKFLTQTPHRPQTQRVRRASRSDACGRSRTDARTGLPFGNDTGVAEDAE